MLDKLIFFGDTFSMVVYNSIYSFLNEYFFWGGGGGGVFAQQILVHYPRYNHFVQILLVIFILKYVIHRTQKTMLHCH